MPNEKEVIEQSKNAYEQWCVKWRKHAKENSKHELKSLADLQNCGVGRSIIAIGNGYSLEAEIETLTKYHEHCDIMCCDKTLGHLIDRGITPTYCMVCDASVDYEKYMKPWETQLKDTILINNICGNPEWADNGNWKDKYFFVNKDIINSELEFAAISGCKNFIPAATNVSGAMIVMLTQSDNTGKRNWFGYDCIGTLGFDYSFMPGKYYAFDGTGGGKNNYMRHITACNVNGDICFTSTNLMFSYRWLKQYIDAFALPVVQCSSLGIMSTSKMGALKDIMLYNYKEEDADIVKRTVAMRENLVEQIKILENTLGKIGIEHHKAYLAA